MEIGRWFDFSLSFFVGLDRMLHIMMQRSGFSADVDFPSDPDFRDVK